MDFIKACFKQKTNRTPIWLMRQAGRYLPQYLEIRKSTKDFISFCKDYKKASEATLQPIEIFDFDAAIIFSDILTVPLEMGMHLEFKPNIGPIFDKPLTTIKDIDKLKTNITDNFDYLYKALRFTRDKLSKDKALIGFCGAPWTLAIYMIEGQSSKNHSKIKKMLYKEPHLLHELLDKLRHILKAYLQEQINSGADAVMIFDSWAGVLDEQAFQSFSLSYVQDICASFKKANPKVPIIFFPKGIGSFLEVLSGDFDVVGIDWSTPIQKAKDILSNKYTIQGNLEPFKMHSKSSIKQSAQYILKTMQNTSHIFNLGHGILPDTPLEHVKYLVDIVRGNIK